MASHVEHCVIMRLLFGTIAANRCQLTVSLNRQERPVKFNALRHMGTKTLRGSIPKRYHSQFFWSDFDDAETALLVFGHGRDDVVISSVVSRALTSVTDLSEQHRIAVGGNFTAEAAKLLTDSGFRIYTSSEFAWTDDSYKNITKAV